MNRNKFSVISVLGLLSLPVSVLADSNVTIEGSGYEVIELGADVNAGLNNIFVVYDIKGCSIVYNGNNCQDAVVYRYSNLGAGFQEEINNVEKTSTTLTIVNPEGDMGYVVEIGTSRYYFWVVNYIKHIFTLTSVSPSSDINCDYSVLEIDGNGGKMEYYSINGRPQTINREIYVDYTTQVFDEERSDFVNTDTRKVYESIDSRISITPPAYCATYFTVSGDRFLRQWGMEVVRETSVVEPVAVDSRTEAVQAENDSDEPSNVIKGDESALGGSAPAEITFYAYTTEGVIDNEWQMSRDSNFENPEYRFKEKNLTYTFDQEGTYYLRFIGSNFDGTCETYGDTYTVNIGASELKIPNAFSPNDDGVNDVWKVSYRSLIDFHCEIFNRNGQKIFGFDSPDQGWDGTWHGKKVKPGVYYYVITATGADGRKYKKAGDINIIEFNSKYNTGSGSGSGSYDETIPE